MSGGVRSRQEVVDRLRSMSAHLRDTWGVRPVAIIGSFARDEAGPESDVDILIEVERPIGLEIADAAAYVEAGLGRPVDLVSDKWMRPRMRRAIEADLVRVET
jgi:predicted nucleotidyltransferase